MKKPVFPLLLFILLLLPHICAAAPLEKLGRQLQSPNPAERLDAVRQIAINYTEQGLPFLLQAAEDRDEFVRERAIQGLDAAGGIQAVTAARKALEDPDPFVRWRAVQALSRLGVRDVVEQLGALLADESWRVKVTALELLGTIAGERMKRSSAEISSNQVIEPVRSYLIGGLEDPDERVSLAAAWALARNRDGAAYEPLITLLKDGSLFVRNEAALALGDLGDPWAAIPLVEAVADPLNAVSEEGRDWANWGAVKALVKLTGQDFGLKVDKWKEWIKNNL